MFATVETRAWGPLRLALPDPASVDVAALALSFVAAIALFRFHLGIPCTLALCAALGAAWRLLVA